LGLPFPTPLLSQIALFLGRKYGQENNQTITSSRWETLKNISSLAVFASFFFFAMLGLELMAFTLSHYTRPFCKGFFKIGYHRTICPDWLRTTILLISVS
jgi:hypothetical protein